ncbi:hypothetical protein A9Y87_13650, partial [Salmonella enterica subsp. enterica]
RDETRQNRDGPSAPPAPRDRNQEASPLPIKACFAFYNLYILKAEQSQGNACPGAFGFTLIKQK